MCWLGQCSAILDPVCWLGQCSAILDPMCWLGQQLSWLQCAGWGSSYLGSNVLVGPSMTLTHMAITGPCKEPQYCQLMAKVQVGQFTEGKIETMHAAYAASACNYKRSRGRGKNDELTGNFVIESMLGAVLRLSCRGHCTICTVGLLFKQTAPAARSAFDSFSSIVISPPLKHDRIFIHQGLSSR